MKYDSTDRPRKFLSGHNPPNSFGAEFLIDQIKSGNNTLQGLIKSYPYSKKGVKSILSKLIKKGNIKRIDRGTYGTE